MAFHGFAKGSLNHIISQICVILGAIEVETDTLRLAEVAGLFLGVSMLALLKHLPAIVAIEEKINALVTEAKADDGQVDAEEVLTVALGALAAISRILFPELSAEQQDRIDQALINAGGAREDVASGYAKASEVLTAAAQAYERIEAIIEANDP